MSSRNILDNANSPTLIVGSVAYDNIITPFAEERQILGGSASYASLACSYFAPTRLVGVVGNDFKQEYIDLFKRRQIDIEGLQQVQDGKTFFWEGKYHENFNHRDTLDIQLNVFEKFRPDLPERYRQSEYVLLGTIHPDLQAHVLDQLKSVNPFVMVDTINLWIEITRNSLVALLPRVQLFVINDEEAELLTGKSNYIEAGWSLLNDCGCESAIVKKGSHGAYLFHKEGMFALPAYPVTELRDPTGAGDSFAGSLLGYLAAHGKTDFQTIKQGMLYATVTASLTVEAFSLRRLDEGGHDLLDKRHADLLRLISL